MFELNLNKLKIHEGWGSGSHKTIYPYQKSPTDLRYVVKNLRAKDLDQLLEILQSIVLGYNCEHESILPIKGYAVKQTELSHYDVYIKMPRAKQNLQDLILQYKREEKIPEDQIISFLSSLVSGLEYLHEKKIVHQNIKLQNALLDEEGKVRLTDITVRSAKDEESSRKIKSYKEDIRSLGFLVVSLCLLEETIFDHEDEKKIESLLLEIQKKYSENLADVVKRMLKISSNSRNSCREIRIDLEERFGKAFANDDTLRKKPLPIVEEAIRDLESRWRESFNFESAHDFHLKITDKTRIDDKALENLMKDVTETNSKWGVTEVPSFHLDLTGCSKISNDGVGQLWRDISQDLKNLQDLALYFPWCANISDVGLGHLCSNALPRLEKLALYFSKCSNITDDGVICLSKNIGQNFKKGLKRLDLYLSWCSNVSDKGVVGIGDQICSELKGLTNLILYFSCCSQITDEGIKSLVKNINQNLLNLKQLALKFNGCPKITDYGLKEISQNLNQNQSELRQLSFDFYGCYGLTNDGIKYLAASIGTHFLKLQELTLCARINDVGLSYLGSCLNSNLGSLQILNLNFFHCGISDEGIQRLGQGICSHLKDLKTLVISFANCGKVTDNGVKYITQSIGQNLKKLEILSLDFSCCDKITTEGGVKTAILNIGQNLKNLNSLSLYFSKCYKVTMLIDDSILKALASIPKVKVW